MTNVVGNGTITCMSPRTTCLSELRVDANALMAGAMTLEGRLTSPQLTQLYQGHQHDDCHPKCHNDATDLLACDLSAAYASRTGRSGGEPWTTSNKDSGPGQGPKSVGSQIVGRFVKCPHQQRIR